MFNQLPCAVTTRHNECSSFSCHFTSDALVSGRIAEVNEAMLTGECDCAKRVDALAIREFPTAQWRFWLKFTCWGRKLCLQTHAEAKTVKHSRIMKSLNKLAGFTGKIIIPFGL